MKRWLPIAVIATLLTAGVALASLKVWSNGETVTASQLNGNFNTLNTTKIGGSVPAVNSDIASNAAISHSKMATPTLFPKGWYVTNALCNPGAGFPCTAAASAGVTATAVQVGTGVYDIAISPARVNAVYAVLVTSNTTNLYCSHVVASASTTVFRIQCDDAAGAPANAAFTVLFLDDN